MGETTAELISYAGWDDCIKLGNDDIELIATTEVGPRIVSFGFVDGPNEFHQVAEDLGERGSDEYRIYGGHRLWYAPEVSDRTLTPDNEPVEYELGDGAVTLRQPTESGTHIRKELTVEMVDDEPAVTVTHRVTNEGLWPIELAPWGITVMEGGGTGFLPAARAGTQDRLPDRSLTFWPYTSLGDDRLSLRDGHLRVEQDPDGDGACKVGSTGVDEWIGYVNNGHAFVKSIEYDPDGTYPDRGCALEVYTDADMEEIETLGPLRTVDPGETLEHVESWRLYDDVPNPDGATLEDYPFS
ncbi:hypothetical protein Hrd1104_04280 [Halorhabdus sp. CBA1104]|uniref:hypothetical protein n=1 Tax=unclassified Halorhabdus TaxID=2621901 RepID=UPI0012B40527|nr:MULTISPECIES: hypothetical protein [unclassified Halorhabdus]QGN06590.1 hypothetical protein Hrd1104_04280 [Halorhabdus sp. CBA1104]